MVYIQVIIFGPNKRVTLSIFNKIILKKTAEQSVRSLLKDLCSHSDEVIDDSCYFKNEEFMDDGSNLNLKVKIEKETVSLFEINFDILCTVIKTILCVKII